MLPSKLTQTYQTRPAVSIGPGLTFYH